MAVSMLLSALVVLWLFFVYTALGYCLIIPLKLFSFSRCLRLLTSCAIGFGFIGNGIMVLCFLHHATAIWIITFLLSCTFTGIFCYGILFRDCVATIRKGLSLLRLSPWYLAGPFIVLIVGYGVRGLLPPTGFDELMYHLSTIKLYLEHGGFWDIYFNGQSDYPMLTEMNFMIGLVLQNDIICKTLAFLQGALAIVLVGYVGAYYFRDKSIVMVSVLIFCTFTSIIANMSNCDVDLAQALWTVLALVVFEHYLNSSKKSYLIVAAIVAGMAVQTKVTGLFVVPLFIVRLWMERKKGLISLYGIRELAVILLIPAVMGLPWLLKTYIYNQSIVSYGPIIIGRGLSKPLGIACDSDIGYWLVNILLRVFAAPWTFSIFPSLHRYDTLGPLFLAILPFLFLVKIPQRVKVILVLMGIFLAQILFVEMASVRGGSSIRYSMFLLFLGAPLIAWTVRSLSTYKYLQKTLWAIVFSMICIGSLIFIKRYNKEWIAFLSLQPREEYYLSVLPEYPVIQTINRLPPGKVVMPLFNYSDYLIEVPYITAYRSYRSLDEMKKDFRDKNIGYIFANDKLDPSKNSATFPEFTEKEIVDSTNGYYLYKLADRY